MRAMRRIQVLALLATLGGGGAAAAQTPAASPSTTPPASSTTAAATTPATPAVDPDARKALERMSAYLGTLRNFEIKSETTLDLVTQDGQRVQLDGSATYKVRRPDGFVITVNTDWKKRTYYYDGKQFVIYAPELG